MNGVNQNNTNRKTMYALVGRYMDGKEVTAYHLSSIDTGKAGRFSREQVAYLVGKGQITNCTGQIYKDQFLLRGKGMDIKDLPIQYENGTMKNQSTTGKQRRKDTAADVMERLLIVARVAEGNRVVAYVLRDAGGNERTFNRMQTMAMAEQGKIGNARLQNYEGKPILKGVNCELKSLPVIRNN